MLLCWHPQVFPSVLFRRSKAKDIPTSCLRAGRQRVNKQLSQVAEHLSCRERLGTFIELLRWFLPASSSWCTPAQGIEDEPAQSTGSRHPWEPSDAAVKPTGNVLFLILLKESFERSGMCIWSLLLPLVFSLESLTGIWMMQAQLNASAQKKVRGKRLF